MVTLAWKCAAIPATRPAAALQRSEKSTGNKMCFISNMGRLGSNAIFRLLHLDGDALIQKSCLAVARSQHNRVKAVPAFAAAALESTLRPDRVCGSKPNSLHPSV